MRITFRLLATVTAVFAFVALAAFLATTSTAGSAAGKTLVELDTNVAPDLDPDGTAPADPGFMTAELNMFDTLVNYPTKLVNGTYVPNYQVLRTKYAPALATSYKQTGPTTWVFTLRKGVRSCAGNELTSADVVWTFARAKSVSGTSPIAGFVGVAGGLFTPAIYGKDPAAKKLKGEVTAVGKYGVRFKQTGPNALFPAILTTWLGAPFDSVEMKKHATAADPWAHKYTNTEGTAGFGAYCLKSWKKGSSISFEANPKYWGGPPAYTKIVVNQVPSDSQRLAGLLNGTANVVTGLTPAQTNRVASAKNLDLISWNNSANMVHLGINYMYPPFDNPQKTKLVRKAIAYALPYNSIGKQIYYGKFKQPEGQVPSGFTGYWKVGKYAENLAKAKALMAQAGFPNGQGLPADSKAFELTYTAERSSTLQPMANLISTALARIGIKLKLNPLPAVQEIDRETRKYDLGMFIRDGSRALVADAGYDSLLYYGSPAVGGLSPSVNYASKQVDALYLVSAKTTGAKRQAALTRMQKVMMDDLSMIPIGSVASQLPVSKGITGWYGNVYDTVVWRYLK